MAVDGRRATGHVLRPGSKIQLALLPTKDSQPLLGFGFLDVRFHEDLLDGHCHGAQNAPGVGKVNTCRFTAGNTPGTTTVTTQMGGELELIIPEPDAVPNYTMSMPGAKHQRAQTL